LFLESFEQSLARYRGSLDTIRAGRLALGDADLDSAPTRWRMKPPWNTK
jgi:hypothetical protein